MKQLLQFGLVLLMLVFSAPKMLGQEASDPDLDLKMELYKKHKKEALAYTKKDFDALFFEFFSKLDDQSLTLTKEEYYTYTMKIAIYNERQGLLYKGKKDEARESKEKWFSKKYQDYLSSK